MLISGAVASGVSSSVPYTIGNGGTYAAQSISSTGVTGLTATISAGNFAAGNGNLSYTISGTPSSIGNATFALSTGGKSCALILPVLAFSTINTTAVSFVTTNSAVSGGNITSDGGFAVTARGICWDTSSNPTTALITRTSNGTGIGSFVSNLTNLVPGKLYYVRAYATNAAGTVYGTQVSFTTIAGTVSDINGNVYNTITIGNQVWMKENLKVTKYRNGDPIPGDLSDASWTSTTSGAYDRRYITAYESLYGNQYNWYAVADSRGLCPVGWHVPSKADWNVLNKFLDGASDTACVGPLSNSACLNTAGGQMKKNGFGYIQNADWYTPNTGGTNTSHFTALPGGLRNETGVYYHIGLRGYYWASNSNASCCAWHTVMYYSNAALERNVNNKQMGYSVRCLRDNTGGMPQGISGSSGKESEISELGSFAKEEILINPNPANTEVNLEIASSESGDCRVEISDMLGRVVLEEKHSLQPGANVISYDIRNFRNGIYQVKVERGSSRKVYRLVKN
jgi:uncharacterized protein (TIGR02145 family)